MDCTPLELTKKIVKILNDKKGADIHVLNIEKRTVLADYFVIVTGSSRTQVKALSDEVEVKLSEQGIPAGHIEGVAQGGWILMDYGSVVVHIFSRAAREYYNLERLWSDGVKLELEELV